MAQKINAKKIISTDGNKVDDSSKNDELYLSMANQVSNSRFLELVSLIKNRNQT